MEKKLFAISDIHGFYSEMITALDEAGFDENDENHLLIVLGDIFDRGPDAVKVYEYLKRLSDIGKAIVLRGNHDNMLIEYLNGTRISPHNYLQNGTNETLGDFLQCHSPFEYWCVKDRLYHPTYNDFGIWITIAKDRINEDYPELLSWLEARPYYYETEHAIFTHGAINGVIEDWHNSDWKNMVWDDGSFFGSNIKNTNKMVIIGHFGTAHLRTMYTNNDKSKSNEILIRDDKRVIAIDGTTVLSGIVNVLVMKDNLLEEV